MPAKPQLRARAFAGNVDRDSQSQTKRLRWEEFLLAQERVLERAAIAGLVAYRDRRPVLLKPQLREFVLHGARFAFPAVHGPLTRGVPTAYAAEPLNMVIAPSSDPPPVWPHKDGGTRGVALAPLYPTVPDAALRDEKLYPLLTLFDALRSGQARERNIAQKMLEERI